MSQQMMEQPRPVRWDGAVVPLCKRGRCVFGNPIQKSEEESLMQVPHTVDGANEKLCFREYTHSAPVPRA